MKKWRCKVDKIYALLKEPNNSGVFICISEMVVLETENFVNDIVNAKILQNSFISLKTKNDVIDFEIEKNDMIILEKAILEEEAALIILSLDGDVMVALDIS